MKLDFEFVHLPDMYHEAADVISRLPQDPPVKESTETGVENDTPTYCIVGNVIKPSNFYGCRGTQNTMPMLATK